MNFFIFLLLLLSLFGGHGNKPDKKERIVIDSHITLEAALKGKEIPNTNIKNLQIVDVEYYSFDHRLHKGQLIINKELSEDITEIFKLIKEKKFPIKKVVPINNYNWSDESSMKDNNTSAFNYRVISGTRTFSTHSLGRAIDINPFQNPQLKNGKVSPEGAVYNKYAPGTITSNSWLTHEFYKRGWRWGGSWKFSQDYQHFEKTKPVKQLKR
ncbi:MAG: M15 family metallopeptidase [Ignavibacteriaceae bacterium]|nr:M15 family metallopeptidase [Ignavibacteriaceae bacterium]